MVFLDKLHWDCCFSSRFFGSRGGAVCPLLEIGCHVTPLEVVRGRAGEDVSVAASGTGWAWRIVMIFCRQTLGLCPVLMQGSHRWTGRRRRPIMCGLVGGLLVVARGHLWRCVMPRRVCVGRRLMVTGWTMGPRGGHGLRRSRGRLVPR